MWKRDEQQKSTSDVRPSPNQPSAPPTPPSPPSGASLPQPTAATTPSAVSSPPGGSLFVKGEISANEDLVLHGRVEGNISLPGHVLTIGPHAEVSAEIVARALIIQGSVTGNVRATERFEIRPSGRMKGDVTCPSVVMSEGSEFTGRVDMRRSFAKTDGPLKDGERRREPSAV